jgi:hypothetical protein
VPPQLAARERELGQHRRRTVRKLLDAGLAELAGKGYQALRDWVERFGQLYLAHATIIGILSQAEVVGEAIWADGMRVLFGLGQAIAQGMTAAGRSRQAPVASAIRAHSGTSSPRWPA